MKDKILPDDINSRTLDELKYIANKIIEKLEREKNLDELTEDYKKLIKLNNIIEKKFQITSRQISNETKEKIKKIVSKNVKKTK
jgi:hypothetical protein|tara:strand:+ start:209 stop:460 length:252 start_codon:yes stop_codon:yes gene_type:complete